MGHHHTIIRGEGKNQTEAKSNAINEFLYENGSRHSVRDCSHGTLIDIVPPFGVVRYEGGNTIYDFTTRNPDAPKKEWVEIWEFNLHTHA